MRAIPTDKVADLLDDLRATLKDGVELLMDAPDVEEIVRCKYCKHRPTDNRGDDDLTGFAIEFPDSICPCQCEDGWYNWYPADNWFCANGERRADDGTG